LMKNNKLYSLTGADEIAIFPATETDFYPKTTDTAFLFSKDAKGNVSVMTIARPGAEKLKAVKIK